MGCHAKPTLYLHPVTLGMWGMGVLTPWVFSKPCNVMLSMLPSPGIPLHLSEAFIFPFHPSDD